MTLIQKLKLGDSIVVGPDVVLIITRVELSRITLVIDAPSAWKIERTRRDGSVPQPPQPDVPNVISVSLDSRD